MNYSAVLFYRYVTIEDPERLREREMAVLAVLSMKGRVIIATEGMNAIVEGTSESVEKYISHLMSDTRFKKTDFKVTETSGTLFPRLSVKVRSEIVTSHLPPEIDPRKDTGTHLKPATLHAWFEEGKDFELIDMRNDYEHAVGHFKGSHKSGMQNFKELPQAVQRLSSLKNKTVVTFCTGGVRCEKASAYLKSQGFTDVYQLEGGIHRYMEQYPGKDFHGTLYTFDGRITMDFGGEREIVGTCVHCSASTEAYADCNVATCGNHFLACNACRDTEGRVGCHEHHIRVSEMTMSGA
jgi:UPF0176 protein